MPMDDGIINLPIGGTHSAVVGIRNVWRPEVIFQGRASEAVMRVQRLVRWGAAFVLSLAAAAAVAQTGSKGVETYSTCDGCRPGALVAAGDGSIWFTDGPGNRVGRLGRDGRVTLYAIPTPGSLPEGIA